MTRTDMLARVRTLLDEASASFWTDTEIYSALADGQQEVANYLVINYRKAKDLNPSAEIPPSLVPLYNTSTSTTASGLINKPTGFWHLLYALYAYSGGTSYNCRIQPLSPSLYFDLDNTYLTPSSIDPAIYQAPTSQLYFKPTPIGTATYTIGYIKLPDAISVSTDATLPVQTHQSIVHWATAQMLFKDQRPQEAQIHLQNFINELQIIG